MSGHHVSAEAPIRTFVVRDGRAAQRVGAVFEHFFSPPSDVTIVLLYEVEGSWVQEVYSGVRYSQLLPDVVNALSVSDVVLVTVVAATAVQVIVDPFADEWPQEEDNGPGVI